MKYLQFKKERNKCGLYLTHLLTLQNNTVMNLPQI
nr:MAG TPA: hypothetical protein [Caudoviricetes sp.]